MESDYEGLRKVLAKELMDIFIRGGLIAFLVIVCLRIFSPFMGLLVWALILAVTLYPIHQNIACRVSNKQGRAATLLVCFGLLVIGIPTLILGASFTSHIYAVVSALENNTLSIQGPNASVADWPFIGEKLHEIWSHAAESLPVFLSEIRPQLVAFLKIIFSFSQKTAGGMLVFCAALVLSGVMMAYGKPGSDAILRVLSRFTGVEKGIQVHTLATKTVRSIAMGVIGVAFIQSLLLGLGFSVSGIPAAGVLTFIALLLGIAQVPAILVTLPAITYLWGIGDGGMLMNIAFTIYFIAASLVDNVLKPMMLGRGVDAPMPIILIGALGGMITGGFVGLFVGGVVLAVGYKIFMQWVEDHPVTSEAP